MEAQNSMLERGRAVQSLKITTSSRSIYRSRVNKFSRFVCENYPAFYSNTSADLAQNIILPLNEDIILSFFASLYNEEEGKYTAATTIGGYRSAINYLYRERGLDVEKKLKDSMDDFCRGYKRRIAQAKESGEVAMTEGKEALSVQGYRILCNKSLAVIHYHLFTVLQWNLMARSASVSSLLYNHIGWEGDSMVIRLPRHKGDQEGKRTMPRHLYANALEPNLCPILALAVYMLCNPYHMNGDQRLFYHDDIKRDYCTWLAKCFRTLTEEELALIGARPVDLGTHSIRKGVATHVSSLPGTANIVSIFLRLGWSLGNVANRYLFEGEGGQDQMIGRIASLLPYD